jgi:hypothetical protein
MVDDRAPSRWAAEAGPIRCHACGQPFLRRDRRVEAQLGKDGQLYCYGTTCEVDTLEAGSITGERS